MSPKLVHFFAAHPMENSLEVATKMIKKKLHCALEALEKEDNETEYWKYMSEAHAMIEAVFTELSKNPLSYK